MPLYDRFDISCRVFTSITAKGELDMTQNEVEQLVTAELEKQGYTNINFKNVIMGENTIRTSVTFKRDVGGTMKDDQKEDQKELIVLRMGGTWRVLL